MAKPKTVIKRFMRAQPPAAVELAFILENVEDPVNVGAIFRIADACRVHQMLLTGITATPPHKLISRVGRNKHTRVPYKQVESVEAAINELKAEGFTVYAVEIGESARPYCETQFAPKSALLVGHEDHGVTSKARKCVDAEVFIPMYGKGASLNVHVALAVTAFAALHQNRSPSPSADESDGLLFRVPIFRDGPCLFAIPIPTPTTFNPRSPTIALSCGWILPKSGFSGRSSSLWTAPRAVNWTSTPGIWPSTRS